MTQPLNYERGRVIYRGEFSWTLWKIGPIVLLAFTFLILGIHDVLRSGVFGRGVIFILFGGGIGTAIGFAVFLDGLQISFEIRTDGILHHRKLIAWTDIRRVCAYGSPHDRTIELFYDLTGYGLVRHTLPENHRITPTKYQEILAELEAEVGVLYPQLELGGYHAKD